MNTRSGHNQNTSGVSYLSVAIQIDHALRELDFTSAINCLLTDSPGSGVTVPPLGVEPPVYAWMALKDAVSTRKC